MESFFQSTLTDLVKAMRSTNLSEAAFLDAALTECKREIRSTDPHIKATALQKVTFISMLQGADMGWASFHCLEVMSQARFWHKQAGYLAMANSFTGHSDLLLLATNHFRKDLASSNEYEAAQALNALSRVLTPSLARDLLPDVCQALSSSRLAVRKRAVLVLHHFFRTDADAAPQSALKPLVAKLQDSDTAVVCCAVNVLCELVCSSPTPALYLPLAPPLFALLTQSTNTWLVIKLVKLFGVLAPLEPRLAAKLAAPLVAILRDPVGEQRHPAKSLAYECVRTATVALPHDPELMALCADKLREFIQDQDANLRYLGLLALARLLPAQIAVVAPHRATALSCLTDADPTIQQVALRLVRRLVENADDASDVSEAMLRLLREGTLDPDFQHQLIAALLELNSRDHYALVADFAWYAGVLVTLAQVSGSPHGEATAAQLIDIALRVPDARPDLVHHLRDLLLAPALLLGGPAHPTVAAALGAAAWITGEYASHVRGVRPVLEALLQPNVTRLPPDVQAVYVQAILKVLVHALLTDPERPTSSIGTSLTAPTTPSPLSVSTLPNPPPQEAVPSSHPSQIAVPSTPLSQASPQPQEAVPSSLPSQNAVFWTAPSSPLPHETSPSIQAEPKAFSPKPLMRNLANLKRAPDSSVPQSLDTLGEVSRACSKESSADSDPLSQPSLATSAASPAGAYPSALVSLVRTHLGPLLESPHSGVQQRAVTIAALLDLLTGNGYGNGNGTGKGNGNVNVVGNGKGDRSGNGSANGSGTRTEDRNGNGERSGSGIVEGNGNGTGNGDRNGNESKDGSGKPNGTRDGDGNGNGDGDGNRNGNGIGNGIRALRLLAASSSEELRPVAAQAQSLVEVPEGLRLETSLAALAGLVSEREPSEWGPEARAREDAATGSTARVDEGAAEEEARAAREAHRQRYGQYYLPSDEPRSTLETGQENAEGATSTVAAPLAKRKPARALVKLDEELPPGVTRWMSGEGLKTGGTLKGGVLEENVAGLLTRREAAASTEYSQEAKARKHRSKAREGRRRTKPKESEPQLEGGRKESSKSSRHHKARKKKPLHVDDQAQRNNGDEVSIRNDGLKPLD